MYDFIRGPLVWVAFLVFIFGTAYQVYRFYQLSRPKDRYRLRIPFGKPPRDRAEIIHAGAYGLSSLHPGASLAVWSDVVDLIQMQAKDSGIIPACGDQH